LSILLDLSDERFFVRTVTERFDRAATELVPLVQCSHELDTEGLLFAHNQYAQNISDFAVNLDSENPDHYKRSGALLHALYRSNLVSGICFEPDKDEIEGGFTRIHYQDGVHTISMMDFYEEYHGEIIAFDLAYDACASYEIEPPNYDFDYLYNMCRYLKANNSLCLDTFFMVMKSLMQH
jgi:hypothetical protein